MFANLIDTTMAAGGTETVKYGMADVTALVVGKSNDFVADDFLTVSLTSPLHKRKVLVNRISLRTLAAVSDIRAGHSRALQEEIQGLTGATVDMDNYGALVDLGMLRMRPSNSELTVTLEAGVADDYVVVAAQYDEGPDYVRSWHETPVLSDTFARCEELYLVTSSGVTDPAAVAGSILVESHYGSFLTTIHGLAVCTATIGRIEAIAPQFAFLLHKNFDAVVGSVRCSITGLATPSNWTLVSCTREHDFQRVSRGTMEKVADVQRRLAGLEVSEQRALARAELAPRRQTLNRIAGRLNVVE